MECTYLIHDLWPGQHSPHLLSESLVLHKIHHEIRIILVAAHSLKRVEVGEMQSSKVSSVQRSQWVVRKRLSGSKVGRDATRCGICCC